MVMIPNGPGQKNNYVEYITLLKDLVNEGKVPQRRIDDAVRRIVLVKSRMHLFDHPCSDPALTLGGRIGRAPPGRARVRAEIARAAEEREEHAAALEACQAAGSGGPSGR